jgi:hypothetical protein
LGYKPKLQNKHVVHMLSSTVRNGFEVQRIVLHRNARLFGLRLASDLPTIVRTKPELLSEHVPLGATIIAVNGTKVTTSSETCNLLRQTRVVQLDLKVPLNPNVLPTSLHRRPLAGII